VPSENAEHINTNEGRKMVNSKPLKETLGKQRRSVEYQLSGQGGQEGHYSKSQSATLRALRSRIDKCLN
jgi:hypothetical protein